MRVLALVLALAPLLALAACKGTAPAPELVFREGDCGALACARLDAGATIAITLAGDELVARATDLPEGSTITVGDRTSAAEVRIPIGGVLHKLTIRQVVGADEIDFSLPLSLALPGHAPAQARLPPVRLGRQLVERLAAVVRGPVVFANEAAPLPRHTAVLAEWSDNIVFGPAKLMEDIDWIALPVDGETEATLTIYERRTGKVVEDKTFAAQPDRNVMKAWLAERVEAP